MTRTLAAAAAIVIVLAMLSEPIGAQCAMCRRALESPEGQQLASALRRGIMVLFAAPFLLFGIVAMLAVRLQRRRQATH